MEDHRNGSVLAYCLVLIFSAHSEEAEPLVSQLGKHINCLDPRSRIQPLLCLREIWEPCIYDFCSFLVLVWIGYSVFQPLIRMHSYLDQISEVKHISSVY